MAQEGRGGFKSQGSSLARRHGKTVYASAPCAILQADCIAEMQIRTVPGVWDKGSWYRVRSKACSCGPFICGCLQLLLSPVTTIDAIIIHYNNYYWQIVPAITDSLIPKKALNRPSLSMFAASLNRLQGHKHMLDLQGLPKRLHLQ